jgi:hypothetical protein
MQVKIQKVDSFWGSGWILAQIGESIRPDFHSKNGSLNLPAV